MAEVADAPPAVAEGRMISSEYPATAFNFASANSSSASNSS